MFKFALFFAAILTSARCAPAVTTEISPSTTTTSASGATTSGPLKVDLVGGQSVQSLNLVAPARIEKSLFEQAPRKIEYAVLETEGPFSSKLTFIEQLQALLTGYWQPQPLVDTISEDEKYGNSGDKFRSVGRAVVSGFEGLSNIINKVVDYPFEAFKQITRTATDKLNNLGGKLVGL